MVARGAAVYGNCCSEGKATGRLPLGPQRCTQERVWVGDTEDEEDMGTWEDRDRNCLQRPSDAGVPGGRRGGHCHHWEEPERRPPA